MTLAKCSPTVRQLLVKDLSLRDDAVLWSLKLSSNYINRLLDLLGLSVEAIESKTPMCPITDLLEVLSAKWTIEILRELAIGEPARTRRFLEHVPNLSMKSLRQRLIALEQQGFIQRQVFEQRAPRVEYTLTAKGRKLEELAAIIKTYADEFAGQACCSCPMEKICDSTNFVCPGRKAGRHRD